MFIIFARSSLRYDILLREGMGHHMVPKSWNCQNWVDPPHHHHRRGIAYIAQYCTCIYLQVCWGHCSIQLYIYFRRRCPERNGFQFTSCGFYNACAETESNADWVVCCKCCHMLQTWYMTNMMSDLLPPIYSQTNLQQRPLPTTQRLLNDKIEMLLLRHSWIAQ